jgi:adenosylcobinamide hydrolase
VNGEASGSAGRFWPRLCGPEGLPALVWVLPEPMRALSSTASGGGMGIRAWVVNAQVPADYARTDVDAHIAELSAACGCKGTGVGFLTAATVEAFTQGVSGGVEGDVEVYATVGLQHPTWAAAPDDAQSWPAQPGTVNLVAFVPAALTDAALVNAVITMTEAKTQALFECGVQGTGTASDAACVLAPLTGPAESFTGPRSSLGVHLARATFDAVLAGTEAWQGANPR